MRWIRAEGSVGLAVVGGVAVEAGAGDLIDSVGCDIKRKSRLSLCKEAPQEVWRGRGVRVGRLRERVVRRLSGSVLLLKGVEKFASNLVHDDSYLLRGE